MGLFSSLFSEQLIGLDIGVSGIKAVELARGKTPKLVAYNRIPLPEGVISPEGEFLERDTVLLALKKLFSFKGFSTRQVAVGAAGNAIITKKISVPRMTAEELNHQLYWEAEQYIPFNIADVNLDFAILGTSAASDGGAPKMDVLLVAAKKDYVAALTSLVEEADLEPSVIDNQAFALGNSFEFNYSHVLGKSPQGALSIILDFGAGSTKISAVEGDKTTFTRELRQSGLSCTQRIAEHLGCGFEDAEKAKIMQFADPQIRGVISEFNQGLVEEITRTLDFVVGQTVGSSIQGIFACGGASRTAGLIKLLAEKVTAPVGPLNPIQNIAGTGRKMNAQAIRELSYLGAVAIGLSLRTTGDA